MCQNLLQSSSGRFTELKIAKFDQQRLGFLDWSQKIKFTGTTANKIAFATFRTIYISMQGQTNDVGLNIHTVYNVPQSTQPLMFTLAELAAALQLIKDQNGKF
jgi:hypothetical protein